MNKYTLQLLMSLAIAAGCNTDNQTDALENNLIGDKNFNYTSTQVPLSIQSHKLTAVQGNAIKSYALGELSLTGFGNTKATIISQVQLPTYNPTFGLLSAQEEEVKNTNENETIDHAYLYLPFYSHKKGDQFVLDSIYGNQSASFTLKVSPLMQQLRDVNETYAPQLYFSTDVFEKDNAIGQTQINKLSNASIPRYEFDKPQTTENEAEKILDELKPGIIIPLNKDFFQEKILDQEGKYPLTNPTLFYQHLKGLVMETENLSAPLLMYLNLLNAKVVIEYSYTQEQHQQKTRLELPLISEKEEEINGEKFVIEKGMAINTFENQPINTLPEKIYLQGLQGYIAQITLENTTIEQLQKQNLLVNDAKLTLYVDETLSDTQNLPPYLMLLNSKTGEVLADFTDINSSLRTSVGKLNKDEKGYHYVIKMTDYISGIVRQKKENTPITLGLSFAHGITKNIYTSTAQTSGGKLQIPLSTIQMPKAVVLHGADGSDKKASLTILSVQGK